jgi:hypothetical protein
MQGYRLATNVEHNTGNGESQAMRQAKEIVGNPPRYFLSGCGIRFVALCAYGSFGYVGTASVFSASMLYFRVWYGGLPFSRIL